VEDWNLCFGLKCILIEPFFESVFKTRKVDCLKLGTVSLGCKIPESFFFVRICVLARYRIDRM
jgi:hypothetical protein